MPPNSPVGHATQNTRRLERAAGHRLRAEPVALAQHDGAERHRQVRAGHEHPRHVAHGGARLVFGPDHEPRRVAQEHDRQVERVAQLQEARRLVGGVGVDRAAEVRGLFATTPERPALDPCERGDHPVAPPAPQLEHRVGVEQRRRSTRRTS